MIGIITVYLKDIGERYKAQYPKNYLLADGKMSDDIYKKILTAKTLKQVDKIIGNDTWTSLRCHECGTKHTKIAAIDAWEETIYLCKKCLVKAAKLFK